ncbi:hypothetical protein ACOYR1_14240 [Thalassotalea piscium]
MINNINTYTSLLNTNLTSTSEVENVIAEHKQTTALDEQEQTTSASLYLSSRAQKINSISQEFFSNGSLNFDDIDSLKERVYQLGLISKQDYAHLTDTELSDEELSASQAPPNTNMVSFLDNFLIRLDETDAGKISSEEDDAPEEESETLVLLKETLSTAKTILADVEQAKTETDFKESLTSTLSFLAETINATAFEKMPLDDKVGLSKVYQALEIVDKISPQRLDNDKLNRYLQVALE